MTELDVRMCLEHVPTANDEAAGSLLTVGCMSASARLVAHERSSLLGARQRMKWYAETLEGILGLHN